LDPARCGCEEFTVEAVRFDTYYRYEDLTRLLHDYAARYPELARLQSIGRSFEGRDIWLVTITRFATGADERKPALWLDANIHSAELVASAAALRLIDHLLAGYGTQPEVTRCLESRVFYICPRVNPDGAEWALADVPKLIRSSTRPYPFEESPVGGLITEDIDGDGRILTMRIADPTGPWKVCPEEPRLLVRREPTETGGTYYRLLPEGRIENYDGCTITVQPRRENLDLNRNFPGRWRGEHEQPGAGRYPISEPEVHALVDFIARHRNICAGIALHSYSGALLRPYSYQADEQMPVEDLWAFQKIGERGQALTGYPAVSAYHDFRYHPQQVITGAMDDWLYEELGLFAWTVEIWSPQRQAGIGDYKFIDWYREHPLADDLKLLAWSDTVLEGKGYIDWYPWEHPQLGPVELGGWNPLYSFWNPPPRLLPAEIDRLPGWLVWHNLISPRLELRESGAQALSPDTFRVWCVVQNTGWLPTDVTRHARDRKLVRGVVCEIELPEGAALFGTDPRRVLGQLEGRSGKPSSPAGWAGQATDVTDDRLRVEWLVRGAPGMTLRLTARHDRAGTVEAAVSL
jgi:murein tripeptide amidase MpaA